MSAIHSKLDMILNDFLYHSNDNCTDMVILCGSYATGKASERSDIDLCIVGTYDHLIRESCQYNGYEIQTMKAPYSWYKDVISSYERNGNIGTITTMIAMGQLVYGDSIKWKELHSIAKKYYELGPVPLTEKQIRQIRIQITELWHDYLDLRGKETDQLWVSQSIIQECVQAHFKLMNWWAVKLNIR